MKTFRILPLFLLLVSATVAGPSRKPSTETVAAQLSRYIVYPDLLRDSGRSGVVVVSFRLDADHRLADLQVHTANTELNETLVRRLTGRKLRVPEAETGHVQWVRLRFQSSN
ncbi:hypothetical protein [Larkinella soli]|uniref:hypothetical protein n=1 Tax=Larkinella soli TaxID=1770527 RepID=UPI000FFC7550|nr:hypothetical protein [Larkinella soli]